MMISKIVHSIALAILAFLGLEKNFQSKELVIQQEVQDGVIVDINPVNEIEITPEDLERMKMFSEAFCGKEQADLFAGIIQFNHRKIEFALQRGADINKPTNCWRPLDEAIEQAIKHKQDFILDYLFDNGAIVTQEQLERIKYKRIAFETNQVDDIDEIEENLKKLVTELKAANVSNVNSVHDRIKNELEKLRSMEITLGPVKEYEEKIAQIKTINKIIQDDIEECQKIEALLILEFNRQNKNGDSSSQPSPTQTSNQKTSPSPAAKSS